MHWGGGTDFSELSRTKWPPPCTINDGRSLRGYNWFLCNDLRCQSLFMGVLEMQGEGHKIIPPSDGRVITLVSVIHVALYIRYDIWSAHGTQIPKMAQIPQGGWDPYQRWLPWCLAHRKSMIYGHKKSNFPCSKSTKGVELLKGTVTKPLEIYMLCKLHSVC